MAEEALGLDAGPVGPALLANMPQPCLASGPQLPSSPGREWGPRVLVMERVWTVMVCV